MGAAESSSAGQKLKRSGHGRMAASAYTGAKVVICRSTAKRGAKDEDFSVYEDNVKQTIDHVSREEAPVSFGLVIDTSGSMRSKFQNVSDAALLLIRQISRTRNRKPI